MTRIYGIIFFSHKMPLLVTLSVTKKYFANPFDTKYTICNKGTRSFKGTSSPFNSNVQAYLGS